MSPARPPWSCRTLLAVDVGFETSDPIQTFAVSLPDARYDTPATRAQFVDRLLTRVRQLPGIEQAGTVFGLPLTGFGYRRCPSAMVCGCPTPRWTCCC